MDSVKESLNSFIHSPQSYWCITLLGQYNRELWNSTVHFLGHISEDNPEDFKDTQYLNCTKQILCTQFFCLEVAKLNTQLRKKTSDFIHQCTICQLWI